MRHHQRLAVHQTGATASFPRRMYRLCLVAFAIAIVDRPPTTNAFLPVGGRMGHDCRGVAVVVENQILFQATTDSSSSSSGSKATYDPEEEVKRRLARAKAVLEKSKAKLEDQEAANSNGSANGSATATTTAKATTEKSAAVPFFATKQKDPQRRRERVIKARDDKTGLVQADGEKMAAMSEQEEWEVRSLFEVFENEIDENEDVYSLASQQLAERDVVASIWNLRKVMKTEDYLKIFDKKNRFIGEDN